jgi:beta-aspartyl-dipeptidase (metallo-type)
MITQLMDIECCCPKYLGRRDILIAGDKIFKITEPGKYSGSDYIVTKIPCGGLFAFPGILDQHVHIIGGGGEGGFQTRLPEINFEEIVMAGVTTVVGVLGADGYTRNMEGLYAKAKALEAQGITAYIYSGSYALPPATLTGSLTRDLLLIDKVIGAGEIAISDHRSSQSSFHKLAKLASEAHIGGLLSNKAGVVHFHVGEGRAGLEPLFELLEKTELPIEQFVPTHLNRTPKLLKQAEDYLMRGGNIDLTAGEKSGVPVPDAVESLLKCTADMQRVTVSSDSNGSDPNGGAGKISTLFDDIKSIVLNKKISIETAFSLVTENVARVLKLYPQKGVLREGSDADILITEQNLNITKLFCRGRLLVDNGEIVRPEKKSEEYD